MSDAQRAPDYGSNDVQTAARLAWQAEDMPDPPDGDPHEITAPPPPVSAEFSRWLRRALLANIGRKDDERPLP